ncbi:MAG: extensin family protein [Hyphomicrobiaceae bacterium]|nr:extensin family protein [Hyphomicrobiaceae bacterium]
MALKRTAATTGICALAMTSAMAEMPQRAKPVGDPSWPVVLQQAKPNPNERLWSKADIEQAQARCVALLKGLDVEADHEAPWREGSDCGSPAPMRLNSIGTGAQRVRFAPAPTLSCEMIAGLAQWLRQDVQKLAHRHLGAPLVRIEAMSSYSCRNAYGRSEGRLSEHGRANAIDIAAFVSDTTHVASVEGDWGLTQREIAEQRREPGGSAGTAAMAAVERAPPVLAATPPQPGAPSAGFTAAPMGLQEVRPSVPGIMLQFTGRPQFPGLSRLGGPKPKTAGNAPAVQQPPNKAEFLRGAHKAACRIFGTVLGPEANKTHRNHFHLDMAERAQQTRICE